MKTIYIKLFFVAIFILLLSLNGIAAEVRSSNFPPTVKKLSLTFMLLQSGEILFIDQALSDGVMMTKVDATELFLVDSIISDPIFYNQCKFNSSFKRAWVTPPSNTFDPYNPFLTWDHYGFYSENKNHSFFWNFRNYSHVYDLFIKLSKNEIVGYRRPIWTEDIWPYVEFEFKNKKRPIALSAMLHTSIYSSNLQTKKFYDSGVNNGIFLPITQTYFNLINQIKDTELYLKKPYFQKNRYAITNYQISPLDSSNTIFLKELLILSSQPIDKPETIVNANFPIMLIDKKNHAKRIDKNDWAIYTHLNGKNGDFHQYFFFEKELNYPPPMFFRDWAIDHLAGVHLCKKSMVGVLLNPSEKVIKFDQKKHLNPLNILQAFDSHGKPWRPDPVPEDKTKIPLDRLFYKNAPGRIFGSTCKIWELDIWQRVGYMLKKHPEGIYLVGYGTLLQAEETQTVEEEHAFIQKHGVLITPELYTSLETLRVFGSVFSPLYSVRGWSFRHHRRVLNL